jgi:hypothetical protein
MKTSMLQTAIREVGDIAKKYKVKSYALSAKRSDPKALLKPLKVLGQEILRRVEPDVD